MNSLKRHGKKITNAAFWLFYDVFFLFPPCCAKIGTCVCPSIQSFTGEVRFAGQKKVAFPSHRGHWAGRPASFGIHGAVPVYVLFRHAQHAPRLGKQVPGQAN